MGHRLLNLVNFDMEHSFFEGHFSGRRCRQPNLVAGSRDGLHLLDEDLMIQSLQRAAQFLAHARGGGCEILCVNPDPRFDAFVQAHCRTYVNTHWVGGLLTNWHQVSRSIQGFRQFQETYGSTFDLDTLPMLSWNESSIFIYFHDHI